MRCCSTGAAEQTSSGSSPSRRFFIGISNAAGNLAWNLGQYDFAPPEKTAAYMGVHVMLTGVRGSFAPFLGVWLYAGLGMGGGCSR